MYTKNGTQSINLRTMQIRGVQKHDLSFNEINSKQTTFSRVPVYFKSGKTHGSITI